MSQTPTRERQLLSLVDRARAGERPAFDTIYRRFAPMVHSVLLARVSKADADDLMQEVFLSAWKNMGQLRENGHVGGWLATIARNAVRRLKTREKDVEPLGADVIDAQSVGGSSRNGAELLGVLRSLPDTYRETLVMRLVEGMNGPEIATATGLTHGSVRVNLTRGMKLLRDKLKEGGWQ